MSGNRRWNAEEGLPCRGLLGGVGQLPSWRARWCRGSSGCLVHMCSLSNGVSVEWPVAGQLEEIINWLRAAYMVDWRYSRFSEFLFRTTTTLHFFGECSGKTDADGDCVCSHCVCAVNVAVKVSAGIRCSLGFEGHTKQHE